MRMRNPGCSQQGFSFYSAYFRPVLRRFILITILILPFRVPAQVLGGSSVFNFLRLSPSPQLTALGGVNISQLSDDIGMTVQNPALFSPGMHSQLQAVFNDFYGGISVFHLSGGFYHEKLNTGITGAIHFFNYGNTAQTDAAGNILGRFRPVDFVIQAGAARKYQERWVYGANLKFIHSAYGPYRSSGIAGDIGLSYRDTAKGLSAGFLVRNMGVQISRYGSEQEDLPFELMAGITQKLPDAPFSFSLTGQRLQHFDIRYDDTAFNNANGYANSSRSKFTAGKLLDHLVLGMTLHLHSRVECQAGYNFLRRRELKSGAGGNGLNGFSLGMSAYLGKLTVRYARAYYQPRSAYSQFGLSLPLDRLNVRGTTRQNKKW